MTSFPLAFALTLLVEAAVLFAIFRRSRAAWRVGATALAANGLTHPLVFLVLPGWFGTYGTYLVVAESFALLAEAPVIWLGLRPRPGLSALTASALANGASFLVGVLLARVLGA